MKFLALFIFFIVYLHVAGADNLIIKEDPVGALGATFETGPSPAKKTAVEDAVLLKKGDGGPVFLVSGDTTVGAGYAQSDNSNGTGDAVWKKTAVGDAVFLKKGEPLTPRKKSGEFVTLKKGDSPEATLEFLSSKKDANLVKLLKKDDLTMLLKKDPANFERKKYDRKKAGAAAEEAKKQFGFDLWKKKPADQPNPPALARKKLIDPKAETDPTFYVRRKI